MWRLRKIVRQIFAKCRSGSNCWLLCGIGACAIKPFAVNEFANRFRYVLDQDNYGKSDYWAIPREFLTLGGDCEDYAIIKYFSLRQLGVPAEQLRIVVVQDSNLRIPHAILALYVPEGIMILDNQIQNIVPHSKISHYVPVFSLNERNWWMHLP